MNGYLVACFYKFHMLEKQKLIKTKQPDRPSHVGLWSKVLWKTTTKKRKYYILKRVIHFKVTAVYYGKYYIKLKVIKLDNYIFI